ncbi:tRNA (adenosine(37)-N6)-threonylcarbamoyltransferase complex ATPase subunit type 1 TsaE [Peptococcaceae bacterium]|nr:tRNA (adenosine(37)-N6)-threonylcarbamoyltransferase complex ATPase subunit type 1 TsaE [Peptococcaceae bacterium]
MFEIESLSAKRTQSIGKLLGEKLKPKDIICLYGDLGAGKTCLSKGIAAGLGVSENITSPTFTIIKEYKERYPVYHIDVYRLSSSADMLDLGYEEYFDGDGVVIIEWADIIEDILPEERLDIQLSKKDKVYIIKFIPRGNRYVIIAEEMKKKCMYWELKLLRL